MMRSLQMFFSVLFQMIVKLLEQMSNLACLSLSHCSLDYSALILIARACADCKKLKVSGARNSR